MHQKTLEIKQTICKRELTRLKIEIRNDSGGIGKRMKIFKKKKGRRRRNYRTILLNQKKHNNDSEYSRRKKQKGTESLF